MCYFLCISVPVESISAVGTLPGGLYFEDVSNTPIGLATRGGRADNNSYLLLEGGCSCSAVGNGHSKRAVVTENFLKIIVQLLKGVPSVSILLHACSGSLADEEVHLKRKHLISPERFASLFPTLEEDVRYVIPAHLLQAV